MVQYRKSLRKGRSVNHMHAHLRGTWWTWHSRQSPGCKAQLRPIPLPPLESTLGRKSLFRPGKEAPLLESQQGLACRGYTLFSHRSNFHLSRIRCSLGKGGYLGDFHGFPRGLSCNVASWTHPLYRGIWERGLCSPGSSPSSGCTSMGRSPGTPTLPSSSN